MLHGRCITTRTDLISGCLRPSAQIGGNAITADMPQDDGSTIPFDISVTACIPSVYRHILLLMEDVRY